MKDATQQIGDPDPVLWVSIHASVKDATSTWGQAIGQLWVSIHASVKDATMTGGLLAYGAAGFNPRVREGRDGKPS